MTKIRLLPLVLIAVVALLAVKVLGLVMGVEPFPVGPQPAAASGAPEGGHGEAAAEATPTVDTSAVDRLTAPVDLAREFDKLKEEQAKGAGGHGEAAPAGHGEAAPAADAAHGEAAPAADAAHGEAAPAADAAHGEAAPAADAGHGEAAPAADAAHGEAAPAADAAHGEAAPAADAAHGEAAPAADAAHGEAAPAADAHAAPAEGGHGGKPATGAYTERPKEYSPPIGSSETAILEGLAVRRDALDQREHDLDLRAKLLQAAEKRLEERLQQLQSIESQLGGSDPAAAAAAPANAPAGAPAAAPAGGAAKAPAAAPANDQLTALVSLYESMKPKAAAAVFDKLPAPTLIELASRMNPRKLSPIMAAMNPDIAGRVTAMLVGAQQAQKKVVVQVEQVAPEGLLMPATPEGAPMPPAELPQIMPAEPAAQ